ncbi:ferrous iron transporter B [Thermosediminibacter oceani]|uniref:Ferrous iron transport protein B domain protein n=1 Tax=Thermosediminibacter oceani (strain ATCC BAA-1034 / DSM 16646 / JW/IW-1228P) TaxID=555079 RepID=D9S032_THEOJ|nr:ferrous iron transporter B [Thermosediminibacter oceani]ADL06960.1 Ferrous iron transport protein B domain protein [Thermosediminibacter oceani DSM 16646]
MSKNELLEHNVHPFKYHDDIEKALEEIEKLLKSNYKVSKRSVALLLLQDDEEITELVRSRENSFPEIQEVINRTRKKFSEPLHFVITMQRQKKVDEIVSQVVKAGDRSRSSIGSWLDRITVQPVTGIPILLLVLYFGLYKFVGEFGAGTLVDFIEGNIFENYINPWVNSAVQAYIPNRAVQELLAMEYGIITLGIRYAVAIILPIVGTFFLMFSVIEDSGYLPRLALLVDRVFKSMGLNGRAVIPMTLGFGCDTMATLVSRTLETRRERVIATLLLALAIPCSAQLGVILGLLSGRPAALAIWATFVVLVFLLVGYLAAQVLPGERPVFYMEIPPLRLPRLGNIIEKTVSRMQWYFLEIVPIFIITSVLIWIGRMTGIFDALIRATEPLMQALGLPPETAQAFLFGFFRRDYGAAGLYDLQKSGILNGAQMLVASVTLTLFVPCIAQFTVMLKERGVKTTLAIVAFVFPFAFLAGYILNLILKLAGVVL